MRTYVHGWLAVLAVVCVNWPTPAPAGDQSEYGLAVGQKMPFHVLDYSLPKSLGGCPSVMISNAKSRGLILWAKSPDDKFFQLAKRLEEPLGSYPNAQGHLAIFNRPGGLVDVAKKHGIERFHVGAIRTQSQQSMEKFGGLAEADLAVFFLDQKTIKARWSLKSKDLDQEASDKIVAAAVKFFEKKKEEK